MAKKKLPRTEAIEFIRRLDDEESIPVWEYLNAISPCHWQTSDMVRSLKELSNEEFLRFCEMFDIDLGLINE